MKTLALFDLIASYVLSYVPFRSIRTGTKYCAPCNATEHIQNEVKEYAFKDFPAPRIKK